MSELANQLVLAERAEISRGIRALLASPLVTDSASPEVFEILRRRHGPVAKWFDYFCGWSVSVEPRRGYARLFKIRAATDPSRPARRQRSKRAPFDRRRYVLFCVVAAELLAATVTTIGLLADRVRLATAADPVLSSFDSSIRTDRMALVDVLQLLESFGVLETVDGSVQAYADSSEAKVLYRVDPTLLLRLPAAPVGASQLAVPLDEVGLRSAELFSAISYERRYQLAEGRHSEEHTGSSVQRNLWLRHSIFRCLVDDPVLYFDQLTEEERTYLFSLTGRQLVRRCAEQAGFVLEERAEGMLFVDPEGIATDTRFPDDKASAKVAGLLLLESITPSATIEQLCSASAELLDKFPKWARSYQGEDGPRSLTADAVQILAGFGLVRMTESGVVQSLPAAGRYRVREPRSAESMSSDDQELS